MRVLQVTSDYVPDALWGMGWHVAELSKGLKNLGHLSTVATAYKSHSVDTDVITTPKEIDKEFLSPNKYEIFNDFHKFNIWQLRLAEEILKSGKTFDVIHCHNWMSWLTSIEISKVTKTPIVTTFHFLQKQYELMKENPIPTFHQEIIKIEQDALNRSDRVILLSDSQERLVSSKYKFPFTSKLKIVPHGIDFELLTFEELSRVKNDNEYTEILFVGRIEEDKGIREVINAFMNLKGSNLKLNIVGEGPLYDELHTANKGNKEITFHGYLSRENLKKLLIRCQIFCLPTTSENLPLSLLEAMCFAVVPVFSEGRTVPNVFTNHEHGLTTKLEYTKRGSVINSLDLLKKLQLLVDDSAFRSKLSSNLYTYSTPKYSKDNMVRSIVKVYEEVT